MTITVNFITPDDTTLSVDVLPDLTLMEAALDNIVPGISAICGGACACATCHVYIDQDWISRVSAKAQAEEELLEFVTDRQENSRLSCQIQLSEELNQLTVRLPDTQN